MAAVPVSLSSCPTARRWSSRTAPPAPTPRPPSARGSRRRARRSGERRGSRPDRPVRRRRGDRDRHPAAPRRARVLRHDAAHVLAEAVLDLWPGTKVSIGPPIETASTTTSSSRRAFVPPSPTSSASRRRCASTCRRRAVRALGDLGSPTPWSASRGGTALQGRADLGPDQDEGVETVSLYRNGPFVDLCRGPHGPVHGQDQRPQADSVAGAYWRGDETRQMLTRIYGTAFFKKKDLEAHLERIEQAKARDHRRLGPELELFMLRPSRPGCPSGSRTGPSSSAWSRTRSAASSPARLPGDQDAAGPGRGALAPLGPLGQLRENMFFTQLEDTKVSRSSR